MLQLVYISTAAADIGSDDVTAILALSRRNNLRDGITGLLYFNGRRFMQALEGPDTAVEAAFRRIGEDTRHRAVVTLSRREIDRREFGDWTMAHRRIDGPDGGVDERIAALVAGSSAQVRATFESFAKVPARA